ncbi:MAG TPA: phosphogluconate dehydratase [Acidiphilium sp.]|uniref:phosphogluconate dehydratase n=1 Tax=unclassified Acidiphilium TaxID=2617493 RepID=UPI000BC9BCE2|nr:MULTISPECIES: phosphogluconate dehydratase [unclassified Acidiphilium]OYV56831.1 MAG: phosphogluconate dehydratase [Acidiphilium sp. 20-67-58]HQT60434.1 phosphogluconate dehydratase [Acidiphilium sp.]HQU10082.1 phosphogluconate dehydratase [Acidiphilium sp.]
MVQDAIARVTDRIRARSEAGRATYLARTEAMISRGVHRSAVGCANLAHALAGCAKAEQDDLKRDDKPNIGIVTSYNDMLSAHQPFGRFPDLIKHAVREAGGIAQVAGGVPAMCDGVTQGREGMELSLFSRDVIAMATAIALSHDVFDGALLLGVCDKIVPGLVIAALSFGHLPSIFVPAGPMPSGISNTEKSHVRQLYAEGKVGREELLESEIGAYHSPGTCTFYGTANSNQMLMEIMGLHLPGASFVNPGTDLRDALTGAAAKRILEITARGNEFTPVGQMVDERTVVNGMIGLLATGGSTNHTIHLVAMARAAGIAITWQDFSDLSEHIPLLTRIYPNGSADVNHFQEAGGMPVLIGALLDAGLLHGDARTVWSPDGLQAYRDQPVLEEKILRWKPAPAASLNRDILRDAAEPFSKDGGLRIMHGNLGQAVTKISAVKPEHRVVIAPARVFRSQEAMQEAFKAGELHRDFVAIVTHQGPQANGMPELHKLTPPLGVLQDLGFKVGLVTDGRMSGASGKVPSAIHVTPECACGGALAKVRDGDMIRLDCEAGILEVQVDQAEFAARPLPEVDLSAHHHGIGRDLFGAFRAAVAGADLGASVFA